LHHVTLSYTYWTILFFPNILIAPNIFDKSTPVTTSVQPLHQACITTYTDITKCRIQFAFRRVIIS